MTKQRTVADIVDDVAEGRIGHREAIERLGLESCPALLDTMRANGRSLWAHRAGTKRMDARTLEVLRLACERTAGTMYPRRRPTAARSPDRDHPHAPAACLPIGSSRMRRPVAA